MKRRRPFSARAVSKRLADAIVRNFALKLISLILAVMIYFLLKPDAVTRTPAVEKMAKAIAVGAGMETAPEPASTNETAEVTADVPPAAATNETASAEAKKTKTNGKD